MKPAGKTSAREMVPERMRSLFEERASGFDAVRLRHLYAALDGETLDVDDASQLERLVEDYGLERSVVNRLAEIYNGCIEEATVDRRAAGEILYARRPFKPRALHKAIDKVVASETERVHVRRLAAELRGRNIPAPAEAEDLRQRLHLSPDVFDVAVLHYRMAICIYRSDRSMQNFNRGYRRRQQRYKMAMAAPAAIVRRMPGVTNNHFDEPIGGTKTVVDKKGKAKEVEIRDVYGPIWCNEPLRMGAMGTLFYILGIASHPSRFRRYEQIDDQGRVLATQNRIYDAIALTGESSDPGGGGHACARAWISQLDRLEVSAVNLGGDEASEFAPDMSIPSSPIAMVEKLVVGRNGELEWVPWSDPRDIVRSEEFTLRFTVADWCLRRMGTTDDDEDGDRYFFNPDVWRCLRPEGQAMYMVVQGGVAYESVSNSLDRREVSWYAADPWCLRFGWADLEPEEREAKIVLGLDDLYHTDTRVVGYARPWQGHNGRGRDFAVFVKGVTTPRKKMRQKIRLAELRVQLREYEQDHENGVWPGRAPVASGTDPPARDI